VLLGAGLKLVFSTFKRAKLTCIPQTFHGFKKIQLDSTGIEATSRFFKRNNNLNVYSYRLLYRLRHRSLPIH